MQQKPKVKTITLGCRFNFYESEISKAIVNRLEPNCDVVIINTCAVTHEAERQSRQAVRKAIREHAGAKIIVTGCSAKTSSDYFKDLDGVYGVIQNEHKADVIAYEFIPHNANLKNVNLQLFSAQTTQIPELFEDRSRAFLQIQNGCDNYCTYCIVPFTRGKSRSLPIDTILNQAAYFSDAGFKEIVLSGIDITSYGRDLGEMELADVIEAILKAPNAVKRIRISSLDPAGISDRLFNLLSTEPRIMPHVHLSTQSGDNTVLRAMRRRHKREDIITLCNKLSIKRPDLVIGSDFIAGFPCETEEMFQNTLNLIDEAGISLIHAFPYSSREGTIAASMIQLKNEIIQTRAKQLREKADSAKAKLFNTLLGKRTSGIIEKYDGVYVHGKTDSFLQFKLKGNLPVGEVIHDILIIGSTKDHLIATI